MDIIKRKFNQACTDYQMLADGDKILIAISGGKDSMLLAQLLSERSRIFKPQIQVEAIHVVMDNLPIDPNINWIKQYCSQLELPLNITHTSFSITSDKKKTPCFLCSWHRRKAIFEYATNHGFNKIALGHHQDDIIITWLMNITFEGNASPAMHPVVAMQHYPISIIRPLCLVHEEWIANYSDTHNTVHQQTPCPHSHSTRRTDMTSIFHQLQALNPEARYSLWHAITKTNTA